jgi:hypothetical protein
MAQFIYWNWKDDDSTANLNYRSLGINDPGVYRGFEWLDPTDPSHPGGMTARLIQDNGFQVVKIDQSTEMRGVILTKQGVHIHENANIDIPITNGDATHPRIDLIVQQHEYVLAPGASIAFYIVIPGTPAASPVAPALTVPNKQTIIGQLYVPANTTDLTDPGVLYTPSPVPTFAGDPTIVHTYNDQYIFGNKQFKLVREKPYAATISGANIVVTDSANLYVIANVNTSYSAVSNFTHVYTGQGYRFKVLTLQRLKITNAGNISLPAGASEVVIEAGEEIEFIDLNDSPGYPASADYMLVRGGEAHRDKVNKFFKQQNFNKGTDIDITGTEQMALPSDGNFYGLFYNGPQNLKYIQNNNQATGSPSNLGAGPFIFLYIQDAGGGDLTIKNQSISVPSGYKSIHTGVNYGSPLTGDIVVSDGSIVMLVEDTSTYRILGVWDTNNNNVLGHILDVIRNTEHEFTKTQEWAWKDISGTTGWSLGAAAGAGDIWVDDDANVFEVTVPATSTIEGIKKKIGSDPPVDFPDGTVLFIRLQSMLGSAHWSASASTDIELFSKQTAMTSQTMVALSGSLHRCIKANGKWNIQACDSLMMYYLNMLLGNTGEILGAADTLAVDQLNWTDAIATYESGYNAAAIILQYKNKGDHFLIGGEIGATAPITISTNVKIATLVSGATPKYKIRIPVDGGSGNPSGTIELRPNGDVYVMGADDPVLFGTTTGPSICGCFPKA